MKGIIASMIGGGRSWASGWVNAWDRFWFTPRLPHTLSILRIVTGLMLLYSHLVLASDLMSFVGNEAWINNETARRLHDGAFGFSDFGRTYLWYISNPLILWVHHAIVIAVTACFAAGLLTRFSAPAAWFFQVMYLHRMTGTLFGLDQIVTYAGMYLMLAPSGGWLSVDAWIRSKISAERLRSDRRLGWLFPDAGPSVAANVATRLLQIHLCVIYLFGGLAKARGTTWWDGTAMWYSAGNFEYQSFDLAWIARYPRLGSFLSHATLFWELSYVAMVWPRLTRPVVLAAAVAIHGGIAIFLGMITFGTMMIAANMIFVRPQFLLRVIGQRVDDEAAFDPNAADLDDDQWEDIDLRLDDDGNASASSIDLASSLGLDSSIGVGSSILELEGSGATAGNGSSDPSERSAKLDRYERKLRRAAITLKEKYDRHKEREATYKQRVARLKEREATIKAAIEAKRRSKGK